jgi:hypothetical protein
MSFRIIHLQRSRTTVAVSVAVRFGHFGGASTAYAAMCELPASPRWRSVAYPRSHVSGGIQLASCPSHFTLQPMGLINGALKPVSVSHQFRLGSNHKVTEGLTDRLVWVFGNDRPMLDLPEKPPRVIFGDRELRRTTSRDAPR